MMRLPLPAVLAALVLVAAGSVVVTTYFKSDAPYMLDLSDMQLNQTKVVELDYIPGKIRFVTNRSYAGYEVYIYINGTFIVPSTENPHIYSIYHDVLYMYVYNGTEIVIKPIDIKSTHVKIVIRYAYNIGML